MCERKGGGSVSSVTTSPKEHVRAVFSGRVGEWAACYSDDAADRLESQCLLSRQRIALQMLSAVLPPPARVLDLGCGTGETAAKLLRCGYEVWGMDLAEPMVSHARARHGTERFRVGDIEHIPFPEDTFDGLVCLGVVEYLERDERALSEIRRVLKPGGRAVISTPNAISPLRGADALAFALENAARPLYRTVKYRLRGKPTPVDPPLVLAPHRFYQRKQWLQRLQAAGLEVEESVCHGWGWYRSRLGSLAEWMARKGKLLRGHLDRRFGTDSIEGVHYRLLRSRALNWIAAEQMVLVCAFKEPG
jgi:SAM-dependent methyltransferase